MLRLLFALEERAPLEAAGNRRMLKHPNLVDKNHAAFAEVPFHSHLQSGLQVLVRTLRAIFESKNFGFQRKPGFCTRRKG